TTDAVGTGLAKDALQGLLDPLAGEDHEAELVYGKKLRWRAVVAELLLEGGHHLLPALAPPHVDEVDDDDAAQVPQPDLVHQLLHRLEVGLEDRLLELVLPRVAAGVDVDRHQGLGLVDHDVAAGVEPYLGAQGALEGGGHAVLLEDVALLEAMDPGRRLRPRPAVRAMKPPPPRSWRISFSIDFSRRRSSSSTILRDTPTCSTVGMKTR